MPFAPVESGGQEMAPENRCELVARAVSAARRARDADRDRFPNLTVPKLVTWGDLVFVASM